MDKARLKAVAAPHASDWLNASQLAQQSTLEGCMNYHVGRVNQDTRHSQLNDLILRAVKRAQTSATKEPIRLSRADVKRPDAATLIPWKREKPLAWDVPVLDTYVCRPDAALSFLESMKNLLLGMSMSRTLMLHLTLK